MTQKPEPVAEPQSSGAAAAVYVYGIGRCSGDLPEPKITGVGPEPAQVRAIGGGSLAALVSDVPADWTAASRTDVEAHNRVLSVLIDKDTIVPMRFGSVMAADEVVRERLLERHANELEALLERLDARVQMTVKAYYVDEALLRSVLARQPELKQRADALEGLPEAQTQDARIALGHEIADAVQKQRSFDEREVVEPLARLADDLQVEASVGDGHVATVHVLVDRTRRQLLDAAVQQLADQHPDRFALRYVGPLPPYSFSALALEAEEP